MLSEKNNTLILNQYAKSIHEDKMLYITYTDIKSLSKKLHGGASNPENVSKKEARKHILCGYSMSNIYTFDHIENKHTLNCKKKCMKEFCSSLRKDATNILNFKKKKKCYH